MKLSKISLQNFRGIKHLDIDLDGKSTILFGVNGVGKSSVLRSIDLLYANIIGTILGKTKRLAELSEDDIYIGKALAKIKATFEFSDAKKYDYNRSISSDKSKLHSKTHLKELVDYFKEQFITENYQDEDGNLIIQEDLKNMPVFVNYGVNRLVVDIPLKLNAQAVFTKLSAFDNAIESKIDFSSLFEWFRMKEDLENQEKVRKGDMTYESKDLKAVKIAMVAMLDGFHNIRIERQPLTMIVEKDGKVLNMNQLSDGEKCTIALFGDLARRLAIANPNLDNPLEGNGVVLIDEVELHMHTQWQRKVLHILTETFPNIQFIITTHSPQVLGEITDDYNIYALKKNNNVVAAEKIDSLFGWDSNVILEDAMSTPSMSQAVKTAVDQMYEAIENMELDKAENYADLIDNMTNGRNESVAKIRVLIARKRRNEKNL